MKIKQFLKPDWRKIVVFVILFILGIGISILSNSCLGCYNVSIGLPLGFYEEIFWPHGMEKTNFLMLNFIIDIVILYFFSCLIIWIYDKFRKRK
jgi:glucan phosphoethanolaminetransferase (alkaline phosphatase superfamily)